MFISSSSAIDNGKEHTDGGDARPANDDRRGVAAVGAFMDNPTLISGRGSLQLPPLLLLSMGTDFCLSPVSTPALCASL